MAGLATVGEFRRTHMVSFHRFKRVTDHRGNGLECTDVHLGDAEGPEETIIELPFWLTSEEERAIEALVRDATPAAPVTRERIRDLLGR